MMTDLVLSEKQIEAINLCCNSNNRIVAITGAAGTGKTTIIKEAAKRLKEEYGEAAVVICAPTGKAARRITQATGYPATTIHRLLEYPRPGDRDEKTGKPLNPGQPKRDYKNPLNQFIILADEYAMVNYELDRNLIDALMRGSRLIVFGDINQLPPIEDKNAKPQPSPFAKHLERTSVTLDIVYRQGKDAGILESANLIRKGLMPKRFEDFEIKFTDSPVDELGKLLDKLNEEGITFDKVENQLITPMKDRWVGTYALNRLMKDIYNPYPEQIVQLPRYKWDEREFFVGVGDKIVCNENCYDLRNYYDRYDKSFDDGKVDENTFIPTPDTKIMLNGETGIIKELNEEYLYIQLEDRVVEMPMIQQEYSWKHERVYDKFPTQVIDHAYALTTHKMQGSECDYVIFMINKSTAWMLNRKNFYTAITRARKKVFLITDQYGLKQALRVG
jgi:exodeoxyribonuclease V alpha subunit